jgi:hypothetical protein
MTPAYRRITGQAVIEFLVALAALVPIFLIFPVLAKYTDVMQAVEVASRYAAFESVAHDPLNGYLRDEQIAAELRTRIFASSDTPLRNVALENAAETASNPLWVDHRSRPLLAAPGTPISARTNVTARDPFPAARPWWRDGFDLRARNFVLGSVNVRLDAIPSLAPFANASLAVERRTALLVEDWTALNTGDVRQRITRAGPAIYPAGALGDTIAVAGLLPPILTDARLEPRLPDWDVVPCDRLQGGCRP